MIIILMAFVVIHLYSSFEDGCFEIPEKGGLLHTYFGLRNHDVLPVCNFECCVGNSVIQKLHTSSVIFDNAHTEEKVLVRLPVSYGNEQKLENTVCDFSENYCFYIVQGHSTLNLEKACKLLPRCMPIETTLSKIQRRRKNQTSDTVRMYLISHDDREGLSESIQALHDAFQCCAPVHTLEISEVLYFSQYGYMALMRSPQ